MSSLNTCMNKYNETETQQWIRNNGMNVAAFNNTHIRLLQAQQQAHTLLTHHGNLLDSTQRTTLRHFQQQMKDKRTRIRLKSSAALPILNISSKINRQLFKQHRKLDQSQH